MLCCCCCGIQLVLLTLAATGTFVVLPAEGFSPSPPAPSWKQLSGFYPRGSFSSTKLFESKYAVEAALVPLKWEELDESASRPVLNLSQRDASPEEEEDGADRTSDWDQGQLWENQTKPGLLEQGLSNPDVDGCLKKCPQLLRLSPTMILESADMIIEQYGLPYLQSEPRLLSYKADQISYGLEFLSTMMMMDATPAAKASPALLISGIEGGIQEQAVQSALGAAGAATSQANQRIAADAIATLQSLKKNKNQQKGLL